MKPLLEIKNLNINYKNSIKAVKNVSLTLEDNQIISIVGESGSGKSTLIRAILKLLPTGGKIESGNIFFLEKDILTLNKKELNKLRGKDIGMIFQDPLSALNPLQRIGQQIEEGLIYHTKLNAEQRKERAFELLKRVGIEKPERIYKQFPHQLSGGMRQRVVIAIALSCKPKILIADEPTTALDVTIQAQILDLIADLQEEIKAGIILITHDLGVVAQIADRVAVMYAGEIVELATSKEIFTNPLHPYTRSLLKSIPQLDTNENDELHVIKGMVPSLKNLPREGCRFSARIPYIPKEAHEEHPEFHEAFPGHFVRCTCWKTFKFQEEDKK